MASRLIVLLLSAALTAGLGTVAAAQQTQPEQPLTRLPYEPSLNPAAMDRTADACVDFYQYSCGGWLRDNPIPDDQSSWDVYRRATVANQRYLWGILDGLSHPAATRTATEQQVGDYFAACMDESAIERRGSTPLAVRLAAIDALRDLRGLPVLLADLHLATPTNALFDFSASQDLVDSSQVIAFAQAGGLGLPDRDYYTRQDDKSVELRRQYVAQMVRVFGLLGDSEAQATRAAAQVLQLETSLARASLTRVERRDPRKLLHRMDLAALQRLTPHFDWQTYLQAVGAGSLRRFNVTEPHFLQMLDQQLQTVDLPTLKAYLRWQYTRGLSPYLSSPFVEANFDFYSRTLRGVQTQQPRWKRCVQWVDRQLGDALGQEFVRRNFSAELKQKVLHMTTQVEHAFEIELAQLDWMGPQTKARALQKLHGIANKIGYPDRWRDYSSITLRRDDFAGNVERATLFEARRQLAKIGKPLDRGEWGMTPPTVNAYYDAQMNDINFPAGVLQPPLYDAAIDDAPNYGNTGGTIGHELTHGFDDEGRQFDAKGNLRDWWTAADGKAFEERAQCVVDQYAQYTVVDDIKINSKLTEGEDIADLGGLVLAWIAWKMEPATAGAQARDGLTPEQRFFVGNAQWACGDTRPEQLRLSAATDPHSPLKYRVNGLVANMPQFAQAFSCKAGQPMVRPKPCKVW
jgi:endothelin-converting enzyme/putative endopeptidase